MFCEKCGAKNDGSNKFCEKCGNKLVAEVKNTPAKKTTTKTIQSLKVKKPRMSKKQKVLGGVGLVIAAILIAFYLVGQKLTSLETMGTEVFKELSDKYTIDDRYLSVPLDSNEYFVSLGDTMKERIEDAELDFDYDEFEVTASRKKVTISYRDVSEKRNYKVILSVEKDGKSLLIFDKYVITKIVVQSSGEELVLYSPKDSVELILTAVKGSKIKLNDKEINESYLDTKKSTDSKDIYVIKGMASGYYDVAFTVASLEFELEDELYISKSSKNEFDLADYMDSSYLVGETKDFEESFNKYITTYYEYVHSDKKVSDFANVYSVTDDIKNAFADSKDETDYYVSIEITNVSLRSFYYSSSDEELVVNYRVDYDYDTTYSTGRSNYTTVTVGYNLSDLELPIRLDYLPY